MSALPALTEEILHLTAGMHPALALARIDPLWRARPDGMGKRALLQARVALMRRAMQAAPLVPPAPEPVPEPAPPPPEPVFVPTPPPKPAPVNRAALVTLSLEDAARMLMAAGDDDEEEVAEAAVDVAPEADLSDLPPAPLPERAEVEAELAEVIAAEAAAVRKGKPRKTRSKPEPAAEDAATTGKPGRRKAAPMDLSSTFAALDGDGVVAPAPKPAPINLAAAFAGMDEAEVVAEDPPGEAAAQPTIDLSAAFAEMGEDAPKPAKPAAIDLSAAFAETGEDAPKPAKPAAIDLSAAFAEMEEDAPKPAKPAGFDLAAQFAAMAKDD